MMKLTFGSLLPQLIVTMLGPSNQAIHPIEELPHCRSTLLGTNLERFCANLMSFKFSLFSKTFQHFSNQLALPTKARISCLDSF